LKRIGRRFINIKQTSQNDLWTEHSKKIFNKTSVQSITPVTLQQMYDVGKNPTEKTFIANCKFLYKEIPIRLSKMIVDLDNLPYGLTHADGVRKVRILHTDAFNNIRAMQEPKNFEDAKHFTHLLKFIIHSHNFVVPHIACAIYETEFTVKDLTACPFLTQFLDKYLSRRISIRMLMAQQCSLLAQYLNPESRTSGFVGEIDSDLQVDKVVFSAADKATQLCMQTYGTAPPVHIIDKKSLNAFKYIRGHLQLMVFELIKNSMRAVCEYRETPSQHPIKIIVCDGVRDLAIKVADEGGGIQRDHLDTAFQWGYTTGNRDYEKIKTFLQEFQTSSQQGGLNLNQLNAIFSNSLSGLGYGLPMCRLYARYFNGDLQIFSMEEHGTDAYLYLNILAPKFVPHSF